MYHYLPRDRVCENFLGIFIGWQVHIGKQGSSCCWPPPCIPRGQSATTAGEPSPLQETSTSMAALASQGKGLTPALRQAGQFGYSAHLLCHSHGSPKLDVMERKSLHGDPRNSFTHSASYPGSDFSQCVWMSHPTKGSSVNKMSNIWPIKVRFCSHIAFTEGHFPSCSE